MEYPSGGNYPETEEDYIIHFLFLLTTATPEQLNHFTQSCLGDGGIKALLARSIMGEFDIDELERRADALEK